MLARAPDTHRLFLGVEKSVLGRSWRDRLDLAERFNLAHDAEPPPDH